MDSLTNFVNDHEVIKERVNLLLYRYKLKYRYNTKLRITQALYDVWSVDSYVRVHYLLGEPL